MTKLDVALSGGVELEEVVITGYKVPLIQQDNTSTGGYVTAEQIQRMPRKNVRGLNANVAGVKSKDKGDAVTIKGSRANTTVYYLDGVRVKVHFRPKDLQTCMAQNGAKNGGGPIRRFLRNMGGK
ncbi:MAG: TonB-dependent receptor plug domain-containing protein [Saprospirales bacterium]|nr:TonB-dependent receptor plug domain-containing protein [Saprospirales bacterium]